MGEAKKRKAAGLYPDTSTPKAGPVKARPPEESVSWEVVGDPASHPRTGDVLKLLEELREEFKDAGGSAMVTVLEDAAKAPVLRMVTVGMGTFMSLVGGLQDLDLHDRLVDAAGPVRGVDAAFS